MRIVVTGGGTGGHIFPALEIAGEIKHHHHETIDVVFAGNFNSLEEQLAKKAGLNFFGLSMKKMVGQSYRNKLTALIALVKDTLRCLRFLKTSRAVAVIGVGGYVSAPMIIASFLLGKKRFICEQNVVPGLTNRALGFIANKVFISFLESKNYFIKSKIIFSGNPVREDFFLRSLKEPTYPLKILITGGSLGAQFLNRHIPKTFLLLRVDCPDCEITHQTGQAMIDEVKSHYQHQKIKAEVVPFIDNMPEQFLKHDLVISRAGATVCAEIMAAGMPSILVPYPFAGGHQKHNAQALAHKDAAIMIEESANFENHLAEALKSLYFDPKRLLHMAGRARDMSPPKARSIIVETVLEIVKDKQWP